MIAIKKIEDCCCSGDFINLKIVCHLVQSDAAPWFALNTQLWDSKAHKLINNIKIICPTILYIQLKHTAITTDKYKQRFKKSNEISNVPCAW